MNISPYQEGAPRIHLANYCSHESNLSSPSERCHLGFFRSLIHYLNFLEGILRKISDVRPGMNAKTAANQCTTHSPCTLSLVVRIADHPANKSETKQEAGKSGLYRCIILSMRQIMKCSTLYRRGQRIEQALLYEEKGKLAEPVGKKNPLV